MWRWIPRQDHFIPQTLSGPIQVIHLWANWQEMTLSACSDDKLVCTSCFFYNSYFQLNIFFSLCCCVFHVRAKFQNTKTFCKWLIAAEARLRDHWTQEKVSQPSITKQVLERDEKHTLMVHDGTSENSFPFLKLCLSPPHAEHKWHLGCCGL